MTTTPKMRYRWSTVPSPAQLEHYYAKCDNFEAAVTEFLEDAVVLPFNDLQKVAACLRELFPEQGPKIPGGDAKRLAAIWKEVSEKVHGVDWQMALRARAVDEEMRKEVRESTVEKAAAVQVPHTPEPVRGPVQGAERGGRSPEGSGAAVGEAHEEVAGGCDVIVDGGSGEGGPDGDFQSASPSRDTESEGRGPGVVPDWPSEFRRRSELVNNGPAESEESGAAGKLALVTNGPATGQREGPKRPERFELTPLGHRDSGGVGERGVPAKGLRSREVFREFSILAPRRSHEAMSDLGATKGALVKYKRGAKSDCPGREYTSLSLRGPTLLSVLRKFDWRSCRRPCGWP